MPSDVLVSQLRPGTWFVAEVTFGRPTQPNPLCPCRLREAGGETSSTVINCCPAERPLGRGGALLSSCLGVEAIPTLLPFVVEAIRKKVVFFVRFLPFGVCAGCRVFCFAVTL
ncbi:hypothetical protein TraAM80_05175 [Trypanosoma rangeli]|uniref:Uncharacterized protein n=1 Tax=Trypanosoma rangeli TaxID=5698 RepID=A0A422NG29_TRYRA|nr:uncharacterized protein TraAM80_05175 [Trypanosoma rangeli]RNF04397.1 hypothetical protein TraAM80_05175 [Trypanosoma rangeli]|eukprot:RNF04397.1 hypothetical protein TraAM80_05175 [Trypanosoma rangeli]